MPRQFLKNSLSKNFILSLKRGRRFIFIYHDVSDPSSLQHSKNYSTSPETFKEQISFLSDKFKWVDLNTINREEPFKSNVASLVFDDGFKSVQTNAMPFLTERKIPFSVFFSQSAVTHNRLWVSDLVFNKTQLESDFGNDFRDLIASQDSFKLLEKNPDFQNRLNIQSFEHYRKEQVFLDAGDILKLYGQGVIIGNHGSCHANLNVCDDKNIESEVVGNKSFLENIIGSSIDHYAIAFGKKGHYSKKVLDVIRSAGHDFIYSSNPSSFSKPLKNELIPRIGLTENSTKEIMFYINRQFIKKIDL